MASWNFLKTMENNTYIKDKNPRAKGKEFINLRSFLIMD
jgi:hypothetical protein